MKPNNEGQLPLPVSAVKGPHRWAIAYRNAVREYYKDAKRPPTNADIAAALHLTSRGWDHRKKALRDQSLDGRDWIEVWPPPRDWHPKWEQEMLQEGGSEPVVAEKVIVLEERDAEGRVINRRTLAHLSALAAGLSGYVLTDLADGRLDGALHLHHVFTSILARCAIFL